MYESTAPAFRNYQATVVDIFEDEKENKAVVWINATAETDVGPYANEKMLVFYFDDAGKISRTFEFIDSASTAAWYSKMQQHNAEKGGK
jgi:ketosteroid isomerase-like protein